MIMSKDLRFEILALMLGENDEQFVRNSAEIFKRHHLSRVGASLLRMPVEKARKKVEMYAQPSEVELTYA